MERADLPELHYITPFANLTSIVDRGILSHNGVAEAGINNVTVAMAEAQERREKVLKNGRPLHDYANLYVCARNPMLYLRRGLHPSLGVLRISTDVLDIANTLVTDINAASWARFEPAPEGLSIVNRELTFMEDWNDPNPVIKKKKKLHKCAEVLVPNLVEVSHIQGIYVATPAARDLVDSLGTGLTVTLNPHLFFR